MNPLSCQMRIQPRGRSQPNGEMVCFPIRHPRRTHSQGVIAWREEGEAESSVQIGERLRLRSRCGILQLDGGSGYASAVRAEDASAYHRAGVRLTRAHPSCAERKRKADETRQGRVPIPGEAHLHSPKQLQSGPARGRVLSASLPDRSSLAFVKLNTTNVYR